MNISKIFLFDDRYKVLENVEQMKKFKACVCKAIRNAEIDINILPDVSCAMYYQIRQDGNSELVPAVLNDEENGPVIRNWLNEFTEGNLRFGEGTFIFCDYDWSSGPAGYTEFCEQLYSAIKDIRELVFVCYSTVRLEDAQEWIDKINGEEHQCMLIEKAYTFAYDFLEFIESTKEAIHGWK